MSTTVLHRLYDWMKTSPTSPAQSYKVNGQWKTISAQEFADRVFYLAVYLESCGVAPGQVGAILGYNSKEWTQMELALLLVRAQSAGLYPNSIGKDIHYILNHTEASVLALQNKDYYQKIIDGGKDIPKSVRVLLVFEGDTDFSPKAIKLESAIAEGKRLAQGKQIEDYLAKVDPLGPAFLIYTSGTTGNPKGASLSHDNLVFTSDVVIKSWKLPFQSGTLFSFLPLCHIAEKLHSIGVGISQRYNVHYCTKFDNVTTELGEVQPTLLLCVPRVWEKMMEGVLGKLGKAPMIRKKLAEWALEVGDRVSQQKLESPHKPLTKAALIDRLLYPVAEKIVLGKVKAALGLSRAGLVASGAAPLPAHVAKWFRRIGVDIFECYGLTESTGMISMTIPGVECSGTVGKPPVGTEFKLAEDGEILSKGRHIFREYFRDDANTKLTLEEGWLHTGDLGAWTAQGLLRIVGRKKEIMKTSGGKMIAPVPIEEKLKEANFISQACLVGDNRKYLSVILTLSESSLNDLKAAGAKAFQHGVLIDPDMKAQVAKELERVNKTLAQFEQVKRFVVIDREFSIADAEMTPTMKMKRSVIEARFKPLIDQMYDFSEGARKEAAHTP